jgi:hypothetical protein
MRRSAVRIRSQAPEALHCESLDHLARGNVGASVREKSARRNERRTPPGGRTSPGGVARGMAATVEFTSVIR